MFRREGLDVPRPLRVFTLTFLQILIRPGQLRKPGSRPGSGVSPALGQPEAPHF